jgi:ethanolamine ammonia-lyase small subunit
MSDTHSPVTANPWLTLRQFTDARIALGRAGVSQPTTPHLAFQLDHARARDAVHLALDAPQLADQLNSLSAFSSPAPYPRPPCLTLHSAAPDRATYLQRPDLGRRLDEASQAKLRALASPHGGPATRPYDIALVVVDGLSARAIEQNAVPFVNALLPRLAAQGWSVAPICIAQQGRVAIGDEVGELLGAKVVVVLIGERPGLSSPDSMGLYMTWMPQVGLTDARRNCISNVRPAGLGLDDAAHKLHGLLTQAHQRQLSGVDLKDEAQPGLDIVQPPQLNFLL